MLIKELLAAVTQATDAMCESINLDCVVGNDRDILFGGAGGDWFIFDPADDWLLGRRRNERVN